METSELQTIVRKLFRAISKYQQSGGAVRLKAALWLSSLMWAAPGILIVSGGYANWPTEQVEPSALPRQSVQADEPRVDESDVNAKLLEQLQSPDRLARKEAAETILNTHDGSVAKLASALLMEIRESEPTTEELIEQLFSNDTAIVQQAKKTLAAKGEEAIPALIMALKQREPARESALKTEASHVAAAGTSSVSGRTVYKVRSGDTLSTISRRYRTSVSRLRTMNGLNSNFLRIGDLLVVKQAHDSADTKVHRGADTKLLEAELNKIEIRRFIDQLKDCDVRGGCEAVKILSAHKTRARNALIQATLDPNPKVQALAKMILVRGETTKNKVPLFHNYQTSVSRDTDEPSLKEKDFSPEEMLVVPLLTGTRWSAADSDGEEMLVEFLEEGRLSYTNSSGTFDNATWAQEESRVLIVVNDGFVRYEGTIDGERISGEARNEKGVEWSWVFEKQ